MVYRFLADHLPAAGAAVDSPVLAHHGTAAGLHAGAVDRHSSAADWGLSLCANLGKRAGGELRRRGQCAAGIAVISGLPGRPDLHDVGSATLLECPAVFLRVVARGQEAISTER